MPGSTDVTSPRESLPVDPDLARPTQVMAIGTILSRLTGFGRLFALAYAFGFTRLTDAYNLANTTPNIVYELVLGGVLSGTLVPVFVQQLARRRDDGDSKSDDAISAVVTMSAVVITGLGVALAVAAPWVIRLYTLGNHAPSIADQRSVATTLLRLFAPQIACLGVISVTTALLNARRRFAAPMYAPILANVVMIGVLLATPTVAERLTVQGMRHDRAALLVLGLGTTAGFALQALVQVWALRGTGLRLRPRWDLRDAAVRHVVRLSGWTVGFTIANQVALWVVLVLANREAGGVSAYQAGFVFFQLPHAVVTVSVITALLPELSQLWHDGDRGALARRVGWGLRIVAVVVVPAAVGYAVLARPLVALVLRHGALTTAGSHAAADVLVLLALGLPGFSAFILLVRAYFAMQDTRTVFWLYAFENALNIALAFALFPSMGVRGLALAYGIAYSTAAVVALAHLRLRLAASALAGAGPTGAGVLVASAAMAGAVWLTVRAIPATGGPRLALQVGAGIAAGVSVYVLAAAVLGIDELRQLLRVRRGHA